jgi:NAD(P)-dependent dehydrogenase (short-subunit alcohol dehydrogenase family)
MPNPFVLVTGSSTGIGKACVLYLAQRGLTPIAAVRKAEDAQRLISAAGTNLPSVILDIADPQSVAAAAEQIKQIVGDAGLAGVVNNAGIGVHGPVEFLTREQWRQQFEVNLFGHAQVTQVMLPLLRDWVKHRGPRAARIVFIGSIAGRIAMPIMAPYCGSKHAIAALAGSLRTELRSQGILVSLIEPGAIQSEIWKKGADQVPEQGPEREHYGAIVDAVIKTSQDSAASAIPADRVARVVYRCLTAGNPPRRKVVGRDAAAAAIMRRLLPESVFDFILRKALKVI